MISESFKNSRFNYNYPPIEQQTFKDPGKNYLSILEWQPYYERIMK